MFTFVIWVIGLAILFGMASVNLGIIGAAFEAHWFWGLLCVAVSIVAWLILLIMIFG